MATDKITRRHSAILAADVVGYSRLIRTDEEGTLAALKVVRKDIIDPKIAEHHGRIVKLMGDGMLPFGRCRVTLKLLGELHKENPG